jgi:hypothetical protein
MPHGAHRSLRSWLSSGLQASRCPAPGLPAVRPNAENRKLSCRGAGGALVRKKTIYLAIVLLFLLHHDFWWWNDPRLVLGFLPIGLAYHAFYSLLSAGLWYLVMKHAWPSDRELFEGPNGEPGA